MEQWQNVGTNEEYWFQRFINDANLLWGASGGSQQAPVQLSTKDTRNVFNGR